MELGLQDARATLLENEQRLIELLQAAEPDRMSISLERFAYDRATSRNLPFDGENGVRELLGRMRHVWPGGAIEREGYLVGVSGRIFASEGLPLSARLSVGPAAQLVTKVGFSEKASILLEALQAIDRQVQLTARQLGRDLVPLAQGYDPHVVNPAQVPLVPLSRHALVAAQLSRLGSASRDVMRATAACNVTVSVGLDELVETLRLATALAPLLAFLTDSSLTVRNLRPEETPRMARSRLLDIAYPQHGNPVPGLYVEGFSPQDYLLWLESLQPMLFTPVGAASVPTGEDSCRTIMSRRVLASPELRSLLLATHTDVRLVPGGVELCCADSLPPRLACAYAALVRGMLGTADSRADTHATLQLGMLGPEDPLQARAALYEDGWSARVYGLDVDTLAHGMVRTALTHTPSDADQVLIGELAELWAVQAAPRDLLLGSWEHEHAV